MASDAHGPHELGIVIAVPTDLPPHPIGTLPAPVRLLRQLRAAGATGPAWLVVDGDARAREWAEPARHEGAVALGVDEISPALSRERAAGWLCASGDLVLSGEGLADALDAASPGDRTELPDGDPAWVIAPAVLDGVSTWAAARCAGEPTMPDADVTRTLPVQRYAGRVRDEASARDLDHAVMGNLGHDHEPNFARLSGRHLSRVLSRPLARWGIAPNTVTLTATAVGLTAALCLGAGTYGWTLGGALLLVLSRLLDDADGEVARMTIRQTEFGARLDVASDLVVHASVFLGLALGLHRADPTGGHLLALALLLGGAAITTAIVLGVVTGTTLPQESRLLRLLETGASGDFAYVFLPFALLGWTHVFLWAAAIGAQAYWLLLLGVVIRLRRRTAP